MQFLPEEHPPQRLDRIFDFLRSATLFVSIVVIILIVLGPLLPVVPGPRKMSPEYSTMRCLEIAIRCYYDQTRCLPASRSGPDLVQENAKLLELLTSGSPGSPCLERESVRNLYEGESSDHYHVLLDTDNDGRITLGSKALNAHVVIWHDGSNGLDERGGGDDLMVASEVVWSMMRREKHAVHEDAD
ncbi:MAG: hypothetical protein HYU36_24625 [Planctomycetes bacterium]|nr:hypothetical protein [Planctomycetota bacterium]